MPVIPNSSDYDALIQFLSIPVGDSREVLLRFADLTGAQHCGDGLAQFVYIPGSRLDRVVLVAHADTVWDEAYTTARPVVSSILSDGGVLRSASNDIGIGVDDRAGCAILWCLRNLGHSLLITNGEECGRQGSKWLMRNNKKVAEEINCTHQFVVQLDRENCQEYKCYGVGSKEFRAYVEESTGYTEPDRKRSTDIVELCQKITGVNLSIGYYDAHCKSASLKIQEWQATLNICRKWLTQMDLPKFVLAAN